MHFGLHLKKVGLITAEQLVAAIEVQLNTLVPIGQLALEEGILSARDIFDILQAQNAAPTERFGDLAIEMGLMKRDDLMRLLMIQADRKRPISEILVAHGAVTQQQAELELAAFRRAKSKPQRMVALARRAQSLPRQHQPRMTSDELITV
jgi:hypothetical protein